jgi:predicted dienelactone hydrolase
MKTSLCARYCWYASRGGYGRTTSSNITGDSRSAEITSVVLNVPGRAVQVEAKVSAPETGSGLPVILLSHGHGRSVFSSMLGYGPLVDFWAAHGFAVIQPTHLD